MKPRILGLVVLWIGTVIAAWWGGNQTASRDAELKFIATREGAGGPEKPKAPGQAQTKSKTSDAPGGGAGQGGPGALSVQSILAQVKSLMRTGGMQNPSAMLKTISLLGQIRDEDIQAALKETSDVKEPQSKMMINMVLLSRWAEKDGPAALKYAEDNLGESGPMVQMAKMGVLSSWAQSDPDAAWEHLKTSDDSGNGMFGGRSMMMMGMFSSLASKDLDKAFSRLSELEEPQERQMALNGIAQTASDEASRSRLMAEIGRLEDESERKEARASILGQVAMMDPESAIKMTAELPANERKEAAQRVGTMLMMSDPERGAAYILENTDADGKKQAYNQVVAQWVHADPNKAGKWLGDQPQTPDLDSARATFAGSVAGRDPESAMAWANTVTNPDERAASVTQVYNNWKKKDEAAASAALESSGLSPEQIQSIRAGKNPGEPTAAPPTGIQGQ